MPPESPPRIDRRQRKSRAALEAAMLELISTHPYHSITVDEIVATADLARGTFYGHYRDKDDLLAVVQQSLMDDLMSTVAEVSWRHPPNYSGAGVATVLRHVREHSALYRIIISGEAGPAARQKIITTFLEAAADILLTGSSAQGRTPRLPSALIATSFVGSLLLTIEYWLQDNLDSDPDAVASSFMRTQVAGLEWALGFEPGELRFGEP